MAFRIVVGMDKFKGTLSSEEAVRLVGDSFRRVLGESAEVRCFSLADGGEGTCAALTAARGGRMLSVSVHDPLGRPLTATYGLSGGTAFMEMASASGLVLLSQEERNPLLTSSYGFGEMLLDAVAHGARTIIAGIGGSATTDGGAGMAEALGAVFRDRDGQIMHGLCGGCLERIGSVEVSGIRHSLGDVRLLIASDVRNPLLGTTGASAVYGPQKGATMEMVASLEKGLGVLRQVIEPGATDDGLPGDGAAGGLGFGCRVFCGADLRSGAELVMEASGFSACLRGGGVDLVVTGEGCTDHQTESGKLCCEVLQLCRRQGIPCVLISGGVGCGRQELLKEYDGVFAAGIGRRSWPEIASHAKEDLSACAESVARIFRLGLNGTQCE